MMLQGSVRCLFFPCPIRRPCSFLLPSRGLWQVRKNSCSSARPPQAALSADPQKRQRRQPCQAQEQEQGSQPPKQLDKLAVTVQLPILLGSSAAAAGAAGAALLCSPKAVLAAEALSSYNPGGGSDTLKTVAGVAYIALVVFYFVRLFRRRAQKATTERISSVADAAAFGGKSADDSDSDDDEEQRAKAAAAAQAVTPVQAAIGAAQAGIICWFLLQASRGVDAFFDRQALPDPATQYTAHNIAVLVQTVSRGLVYLITFIFGANALGLAGLSIQLLLFGDSDAGSSSSRGSKAAVLPKVSVTDDVFALRRAFQEAERLGKQQAEKDIKRASRDETPLD